MLPVTPLQNKERLTVEVDSMKGGLNLLFSNMRLRKDECAETTNLILVEDGILDKRWGTAAYTTATFTNRPDGFTEYRATDGTRELIVVADGYAYKVDEDGTKNQLSGATFTQGKRVYFLQFNEYLYIANGTDSLGRYDGSTIATYSGLDTPTWDGTPLTRGSGLSTGAYTYYYCVTALNAVGETVGSTEQSIAVNIKREDWDAPATEYIQLDWADVTGADKYAIYFADISGYEVRIDDTIASTYQDTGAAVPNPYIEPPDSDTTIGPKFTHMAVVENRIWATGDPSNEYRVYYSGTGVNKGNFADSYGGGWVDMERGGREITVGVAGFQGLPNIWTKTADGRGGIWQINLDTVTYESESFVVPIPTKIIPNVGTESAKSIVYVENDMFFVNKRGIYILGNEPNILDVLRTNELSAKIRPHLEGLDEASFDKSSAYYKDGKVFFALSSASGEPDEIMVFDRERGAWVGPWTVGVSQFGEYTSSDGVTHFLGIVSDKLVEISSSIENDQAAAFTWTYYSPRLPISKNWSRFGKVKKAYVKLRNASGSISVQLLGTGKTGQYTSVGTTTIDSGSSTSGIGWNQFGAVQFGDTAGTATAFAIEDLIRYVQIGNKNNLLRNIQWKVQGNSTGDKAVILGLLAEGVETGMRVPLSAKV